MPEYQAELRKLLSGSPGIAIGEEHWTTAIPNFLNDNMDVFKASGVNTIYTELVSSQNDIYLQNYLHNPTPENLEKIRPFLGDKTNTDQVLKMIENAQSLGIRIVGIDQQPRPKQWDDIKRKMVDHPYGHIITNRFWADRVQEDQASHPGGKFIVHGGNLHMAGMIFSHTRADYKPSDTVPKLLGIPHIHVQTESRLRVLDLSGNQVHSEVPPDERLGSLEITLSCKYETKAGRGKESENKWESRLRQSGSSQFSRGGERTSPAPRTGGWADNFDMK